MSKCYQLDFTKATNPELFSEKCMDIELSVDCGFMISPVGTINERPVPWDHNVSYDEKNFMLKGGMGPGAFGLMDVTIPKYAFNKCYHVRISFDQNVIEPRLTPDEVLEIFRQCEIGFEEISVDVYMSSLDDLNPNVKK